MKAVVFISGRGSNLDALLRHQDGYQVTHVIANKKNIKGFDVAQNHGVSYSYICWKNKAIAEQIALDIINECQADFIILAGFMKILSADFVSHFKNKIINIHPSLLPDFPGLNTHQRALDDDRKIHGASVHFVDSLLDHGQVISQIHINISTNDTAETLAEKLISKEHKLLTYTVGQIAKQLIFWHNNVLFHENKPLKQPIILE